MTAPAVTINLSATVNAVGGPTAIGDVLVPVSGFYVKATTANRATAAQRSHGIALTAWGGAATDPPGSVMLQSVGIIDTSVTGLGAGAASWVRVSVTGRLERATVSGTDDVVGYCAADGTLYCNFGLLTATIANGGGGATAPTGTGVATVTSSSFDVAATVLGTGMASWWTTPSSANLLAALTTSTGTGTVVFNTAPRFTTSLRLDLTSGGTGYTFVPAALAVSHAINLPLLLAGDNMVCEAFIQPLTSKTIVAASNTITDTSATTGDILRHNGTRFVRLARGSANQLLQTNGAGTDIAWATVSGGLGTNVTSGTEFIGIAVAAGTLAAVGDLRFATGAQVHMAQRNIAGTADLNLCAMDASDIMYIGGDSAFTAANTVQQMNLEANGLIQLWVGGAGQIYMDGTAIQCRMPIVGYAAANSPYGIHGSSAYDMANANQTLPAANYSFGTVKVTSTPNFTSNRSLTFPTPASDAAAYMKFVRNAQGGAFTVNCTSNGAVFVNIAAGKGAWVLFDATTGAIRMSADV